MSHYNTWPYIDHDSLPPQTDLRYTGPSHNLSFIDFYGGEIAVKPSHHLFAEDLTKRCATFALGVVGLNQEEILRAFSPIPGSSSENRLLRACRLSKVDVEPALIDLIKCRLRTGYLKITRQIDLEDCLPAGIQVHDASIPLALLDKGIGREQLSDVIGLAANDRYTNFKFTLGLRNNVAALTFGYASGVLPFTTDRPSEVLAPPPSLHTTFLVPKRRKHENLPPRTQYAQYFSWREARLTLDTRGNLGDSENTLFKYVLLGQSLREAGENIDVSEHRAKDMLQTILRRLDLPSTRHFGLVSHALEEGYLRIRKLAPAPAQTPIRNEAMLVAKLARGMPKAKALEEMGYQKSQGAEYCRQIEKMLGVRNTAEMMLAAYAMGILPIPQKENTGDKNLAP